MGPLLFMYLPSWQHFSGAFVVAGDLAGLLLLPVAWPQRMGCSFSMQSLCDCRTLAKIVGDKAAPGLVTFTFIGIW